MFKKFRKILFVAMVALAALAAMPVDNAEAGVVAFEGGQVSIDDSSVYMVGNNHANVAVSVYWSSNGYWSAPRIVEVLWGKGYSVKYIDVVPNESMHSSPALAIANYMSEHY